MSSEVGWIGIGAMGAPMARRLLAAGHRVCVWARRPEAADALVDAGARRAESPVEIAACCAAVFTILTGPDDVVRVVGGMLEGARPGTVFVDMTTASPEAAQQLAGRALQTGALFLDAPVTGGVAGARDGTLTTFVGGSDAARTRVEPLLSALAQRIVPSGGPGSGYRMKLVNQTMMAGALIGLASGVLAARAAGCDAETFADAFGRGSASSRMFDTYARRMLLREGPETFTLGLLRKDLALARDDARSQGLDTRFVELALALVSEACDRVGPQRGIQALAF